MDAGQDRDGAGRRTEGHALSHGHGQGGSVGVGVTNDNEGRRSKGWHDVLWRSISSIRDAAAVASGQQCHLASWTLLIYI